MKYTINLRCATHLDLLQNLPISDVLLQSALFSRSGGMDGNELKKTISQVKKTGKKCVLSWDCLAKDDELTNSVSELEPYIKDLDAIRFTDPGTGVFLMKTYPDIRLEFSLEHGSLNKQAVNAWVDRFEQKLQKVVFSVQMPLDVISSIIPTLRAETEILAAGIINIFYSRRPLLGMRTDFNLEKELSIASDDRPNQWNPVMETAKGTTVFYDKPINIFSMHDKLQKAGLDYLRVEYLYHRELRTFSDSVSRKGWQQATLSYKQGESIKAFLASNPTNRLFSRLKNAYLSEKTEEKIGSVIEAVKPKHCLIKLDVPLSLPAKINFISPERKTIAATLDNLRDLKGTEYQNSIDPGIYLCKWHKYVVTGSFIQTPDRF